MYFRHLLWPFLRQQRYVVLGMILLGLVNSCCTLLVPLSLGHYMDVLFSTQTGKGQTLALLGIHLPPKLVAFFIFFAGLLVLRFVASWAEKYVSTCLGDVFVAGLRERLFKQHRQQLAQGTAISAAAMLLYSNDMQTQHQMLVKGVSGFIRDLLFLVMALCLLLLLHPLLTGLVLFFLPFFFLLHRIGNRRLKPYYTEKRKRQARMYRCAGQLLQPEADKTSEPIPVSQFAKKNRTLLTANRQFNRLDALLRVLPPLLLYTMLGCLLAVVTWWPAEYELSSSTLITYVLLLMLIFPAIRNIIKVEGTWMKAGVSGKKFISFADEPPKIQEKTALLL
jgi:ABC-type multidrug transport system fused ATPase/permease subunit